MFIKHKGNHFSKVLLGFVGPVVRPFNLLDQFLRLARLSFPFLLAHLEITIEEFIVGQPVAATKPVPESKELAVIVVEVEMVQSMAGRAIDDGVTRGVFAVIC